MLPNVVLASLASLIAGYL